MRASHEPQKKNKQEKYYNKRITKSGKWDRAK